MATYRKICLVGFDRVIGSFALGLRRIGFRGSIVGVAEPAVISQCWKLGLIHDGFQDLAKGMVGADLIMLSSACGHEGSKLADVLDMADDKATISEMTRVKGDVNRVFKRAHRDTIHYVGFRLLGDIGNETDIEESNRFYFEGKTVILTPRGKEDLDAFSNLQDVMRQMGAKVVAMSPQAHDKLLAQLNQVPKAAIVAILQEILNGGSDLKITPEMLGQRMLDEIKDLAMLRESNWAEDIAANRELVLEGIDSLLARLKQVKEDLTTGKLGAEVDALAERAGMVMNLGVRNECSDFVLVSGQDVKTLEKASELMAKSRISMGKLEKMEHAEPGTYRVTLKTVEERDRAMTLLRQAGINVESLSS